MSTNTNEKPQKTHDDINISASIHEKPQWRDDNINLSANTTEKSVKTLWH